MTLLCQIPGVGRYTAMLVIAEVGDVSGTHCPASVRLGRARTNRPQLRRQSAAAARLPPGISRLRWALTEAAQKIPTGGGPLRAMIERIAKRRGRKIAKVAIARQILTLCYYGLRDGEIRCLNNQPAPRSPDELADAA